MEINPLWMYVPILVLILMGYPVGFVLGGVSLLFGLVAFGDKIGYVLASRIYDLQYNFILIAIPLFVLMGNMLERGGAADRLYRAMHIWLGPLRGGLALATVVICTILAAATGVMGASVTAMGIVALPPMLKRGYNVELATGTVMAAGCLGILIPPSIMLVLYGAWAELSVGRLFMAALIPGLVLSGLYMVYILFRTGLRPELGPPLSREERGVPFGQKAFLLFTSIIPPVFLILCVLGAILFGIATPTEAAAIGVAGSFIIAAVNRRLTWAIIKEAIYRTARILGMIAVIAGGGYCFIGVFMALGGRGVVEELIAGLGLGRWGILALMMAILFVLGMFEDWVGIIMLATPIFIPIVATMGFDPIWFGALVAINLQMSFLTPPFGIALFYLKGVAPPEITMATLIRGGIPFVGLIIVGLTLVIVFPQLALWLPNLMVK